MELTWADWHRERVAPGVYCKRHVGHAIMYCDGCKVSWSPCCGEKSPHPADVNLVAHLREQLARDPEGYVNSKLRATAKKIVADLTSGSEDVSLGPAQGVT
jgi:hypothetical protein